MSAEHASPSENLLDFALIYLADEWSVFPVCAPVIGHPGHCVQHGRCRHPGKLPLIKWGIYQDRLPTKLEVETWWRRKFPGANIGMATGATSDVVVVDIDGELALAEAERRGYEPGPWVRTGRVGGRHLYFRYRPDAPTIFAKVGGIDFRGQGGFVLLPPSVHSTGSQYVWGEPVLRGDPLPTLPAWVDEIAGTTEDGSSRGPLDFAKLLSEGISQGQRDQDLFRAAAKLRGADVPYELAVDLIQRAAAACRPPFDAAEARAKVDSAYSRYLPNPPEPTRLFSTVEEPEHEGSWVRPVSALLEQDETQVDWLVENLFSVGSSGFIAAEPKIGKSWIALDLAYCLCTASTFLDQFRVAAKRRVLFIEEEDPERRLIRRLKKLIRGNPARGLPEDGYWRFVVRQGFRIDDREWIEKLRLELESFRPEVVFLDVFNKLHLKDENSQADMAAILHDLAGLTRLYGCAFIIIHHYRKSNIGQSARGNQMLRGHSSLAGFAECSLFLTKVPNHGLMCEPESKDAPEMEPFGIHIVDVENGTKIEPIDLVTEEDLSESAQKVLDWLEGQLSSRTLYDMKVGTGLSERSCERSQKALADKGFIVPDGKKGHATLWRLATHEDSADSLPWRS